MTERQEDSDTSITLSANESTSGHLDWDTGNAPTGIYTVRVKSDDDIESFDVGVLPPAGETLFIIGQANDNIYEYSLSTTYDVTSASFEQSLDISGEDGSGQGVAWNDDGSKLYFCGAGNANIYQYDLDTTGVYDLSTASLANTLDVGSNVATPTDVSWNGDGTKMYVVDNNPDPATIEEYSLSTAFDTTTTSHSQSQAFNESSVHGAAWNDDGTKLYAVDDSNTNLESYTLSTAFDVSSISASQTLDVSGEESAPLGATWNDDGTKLYVVGNGGDEVNEYDVSTAFDISTATASSTLDVSGQDTNAHGLVFNHAPQHSR